MEKSLDTEIENLIQKLQDIKQKLEEASKVPILQVTECMKFSVFKALVNRLIDRLVNTGHYFTFILIRVNEWPKWKDLPKEVKIEFLNRVCTALKAELRGVDYATCIEEEGLFAVALRDVGLKIAYKVAQRLLDSLNEVAVLHKDEIYKSSFAFALVEGKPTYTFDTLLEQAKKVLAICDKQDNSIKTEVDLIGKKL